MKHIPTQNEQVIRDCIGRYPRWAESAILALWRRQTESERRVHATTHSNGVGFSPIDAPVLTAYAEQLAYRRLTEPQLAEAYKRLPKYARQLAGYMKGA